LEDTNLLGTPLDPDYNIYSSGQNRVLARKATPQPNSQALTIRMTISALSALFGWAAPDEEEQGLVDDC
jgi:hypothetical protein